MVNPSKTCSPQMIFNYLLSFTILRITNQCATTTVSAIDDNELTVEAAIMSIKQYNGKQISEQDQKTLIFIAKAYFNSK